MKSIAAVGFSSTELDISIAEFTVHFRFFIFYYLFIYLFIFYFSMNSGSRQ